MSEYFEIAYSAVSNRLCIFTGTGFSKAVTENSAPSWQQLLESLCDLTDDPASLKNALFPATGNRPLSLEEAAQIIYLELLKNQKNAHVEISKVIANLKLQGDNSVISDFFRSTQLKIITTNYDKLAEELCSGNECNSLTPGLPLPRTSAKVEVFHVHGSIDSPTNMVVTSDDYFKFINNESYFSRKLSTVLHENTVVILGYSLADTNLKAILSEYKGFSRNHAISSTIFLISREKVNSHIKDYYSHCYGIRVIDNTQVHEFFSTINYHIANVKDRAEASIQNIRKVISGGHSFSEDFLKTENSFYEIISSINAIGLNVNDTRVTNKLGEIIQAKIKLTGQNSAWEQYEHLARWLIYLASILELKGTSIESIYLQATLQSMNTMRKELYLGYSWQAFKAWNNRWANIIVSNRTLIRDYILTNTKWPDALNVVQSS